MAKYGARRWEITSTEKRFEKAISDAGFSILGLKEYKTGFTDYLLHKDGTEVEYRLFRDTPSQSKSLVASVIDIWSLKRALKRM